VSTAAPQNGNKYLPQDDRHSANSSLKTGEMLVMEVLYDVF